jgi:hypothetical protein
VPAIEAGSAMDIRSERLPASCARTRL